MRSGNAARGASDRAGNEMTRGASRRRAECANNLALLWIDGVDAPTDIDRACDMVSGARRSLSRRAEGRLRAGELLGCSAVRFEGRADALLRWAVQPDNSAGEVGCGAIGRVHRTCRNGEAADGRLLSDRSEVCSAQDRSDLHRATGLARNGAAESAAEGSATYRAGRSRGVDRAGRQHCVDRALRSKAGATQYLKRRAEHAMQRRRAGEQWGWWRTTVQRGWRWAAVQRRRGRNTANRRNRGSCGWAIRPDVSARGLMRRANRPGAGRTKRRRERGTVGTEARAFELMGWALQSEVGANGRIGGTSDRRVGRTDAGGQRGTDGSEFGTTSGSVRQRHQRNAGLAGNAGSLRLHKLLLNAPFQEPGLEAVGTDFAVNQHGIALDPNEGSAQGRLVLGNLLRVQDGFVGDFNVVAQLRIEVQPGVPFFRGGADVAAEKQRVGWSLGILDQLCDEFILLGISFVFSHA